MLLDSPQSFGDPAVRVVQPSSLHQVEIKRLQLEQEQVKGAVAWTTTFAPTSNLVHIILKGRT